MTIRIQHLTIDHDDRSWSSEGEGTSVVNDETRRFDLLAVVRHIMRERSDFNMVPVVREAMLFPTNQWGHNMTVEVTYHTRGYRAIYGVTATDRVSEVSCYMD